MYFNLPAGKRLDVDLLKTEIRAAIAKRVGIIVTAEPWNETVKNEDAETVVPRGYTIYVEAKLNAADRAMIETAIAAHVAIFDYEEERKKSERQQRLKDFERILLKVLDDPEVVTKVKAKLA